MTGKINKVLLVEDNAGDALLLREALRDLGGPLPFELVHVCRLSEGLQKIAQEKFDTVLLDLSLPDAQGVDTVVRMQEVAPGLPVVVLTGLDDDAAALQAVRAGAQDYLVKGEIDGRLLVRALSYAAERKLTQKELEQHLSRMVALTDINVALTATLDLATVLKILLKKVADLMPEFTATVKLWDTEQMIWAPVVWRDLSEIESQVEAARAELERHFIDEVFRTKRRYVVNGLQRNGHVENRSFNAYLGIPLLVDDRVLGVLSFYAKKERQISEQETEFLSAIASQASVAIRNSQVHGHVQQLAGRLEVSNRVKEEFLGVISHELRTPLNVVKGYVQLLQTGFFGALGPEQGTAIEKIAAQTKEQLDMINSILQAVSIESDDAILRVDAVPLRDLIDELQSTYFAPPEKPLSFHWHHPLELPVVATDKTKLRYILQNLISNAVKFTNEGHITVSLAMLDGETAAVNGQEAKGNRIWLRFDVSDTGIGIAEEFLPSIFEKFSQVDSSMTRAHGGIGLGLHIVKRCVEFLQGKIHVESEPGQGSTFSVMIPCCIEASGTAIRPGAHEAKAIDLFAPKP